MELVASSPPVIASEVRPRRLRWAMIGLVFLATVINYLDRQTLSVVAPVLREQFHMTNVTYSRIVFGFMLAYTVMNGVSGPMIDRLGTRLGYAICMFWWSMATLLHALATGAWSLGIFRFLLGMGEAGNWPAGVKVVAEWFPVKERAFASGIFNSGSSIGAIIAPPLIAFIVLKAGWQAAFLGVGAIGFFWLIAWWMLYHTPPESVREATARPIPPLVLLRTRWVWSFTLSKLFLDPCWYFYIFWFPQYLRSARNFDLMAIGKTAWIPFVTADLGNLLGGWVAARLIARNVPVGIARKVTITFFTLLMAAAIPAVLTPDVYLSIAFVSIATLGYTGTAANMLAMPADVFPKNALGSIWGLASVGTGLGGMLFSLLTGWILDTWSYVPVFIGFGLLPLVTSSVLWLLLKPPRPGELPAAAVL